MIPGSANPLLLKSAAAAAGGLQISRSIRLNSADSAYFSRAPGTASNRKTWTWSAWVKRSALSTGTQTLFFAGLNTSGNAVGYIYFNSNDTLQFTGGVNAVSTDYQLTTTQVFRDPSSWYHFVFVFDTDNATSSDRLRIFVNGIRVTAFSTASYPSSGYSGTVNNTVAHSIGSISAASYFSGYLTNIHFIDGQALDPSSFTETDATTGQLIPKTYTGSYGTNGFRLNFSDNSAATAATLGADSGGGISSATGALPIYNTTDNYGVIKGTGTRTDANASSLVLAIPMDGTNNGTTFTDESATIKGSGSAKTISRFGDTKTSTAQSKFYGSSGFFDGTGDYLQAPAGTDFSYGTGDFTFEAWIYPTTSGTDKIIYAQTTSGNNYVNLALTTSNTFSVQINASGAGNNVTSTGTVTANVWTHIAVTRQSTVVKLFINGVQDGSGTRNVDLQISSTVPTIGTFSHSSTLNFAGYIQDFRIYKGVAKYTSNFTPTFGPNNWTPNNLSVTAGAGNDSLVDSPTNYGTDTYVGGEVRGNYAVLNPLAGSQTLANGNLDFANNTTDSHRPATIAMTTGKWYCEMTVSSSFGVPGLVPAGFTGTYPGQTSNSWGWYGASSIYNNGGGIFGATFAANDVIQIAFDADAGKLWFGKNGTWLNSGNPAAGTGQIVSPGAGTWCFAAGGSVIGAVTLTTNFGQRAFAYTAPSGFKALCTQNLPEGTITTSGTFTGNASADGPFVYLNGVPTAMTINSNAVTFATHADKLSNGFKLRTSSGSYNTAGSNTYSITTTGDKFKYARAQPNP